MTDLRHLMESNSGTAWLMGHVTLRKLLKQFRPLSQNFKMKMILPECQFISYYEMKRYCAEKKKDYLADCKLYTKQGIIILINAITLKQAK